MRIGNIETDDEILLIAEIGNNHEGDFDLAKKMIHEAAEAGAQAVKFQTFIPEHYASILNENRIKQLTKFQFSFEKFANLNKNPVTVLSIIGKELKTPSAFNGIDYKEYTTLLFQIRQELNMKSFLEIDSFFNYVYWNLKEE